MSRTVLRRPGPATRWLEALPLGNGRIGAMAWGDPEAARFSLNESTLWSGTPETGRRHLTHAEDARGALAEARRRFRSGQVLKAEQALGALGATWSQAYLPVGELDVHRRGGTERSGPQGASTPRLLDLARREHRVQGSDGDHVSVVSIPDEVLVHAFPLDDSHEIDVEFTSALLEEHRSPTPDGLDVVLRAPSDAPPTHAPGSPPVRWDEDASRAAIAIRWEVRDGRCLLVCAIVTSWKGLDRHPDRPAEEILREAATTAAAALDRGEEELLSRHTQHAPAGAGAMSLELGGGRQARMLADVVAYGRYLLAASSRPGLPPANLQGIWNREVRAPWSSNYTTNINVEMNHWAVGPAHLPGAAGAFEGFVELLRSRGRETARRLYAAGGWTLHHNTDAWGYTDPVDGDARWAIWPMGGLWLERQLDDIASFSGADPGEIARRRFAPWREAARFALDLLHENADGQLVTFPSTSPENRWLTADGTAVALSEGTGMDRWLVRETLRALVEAAELLGQQSDPVVERAAAALGRVPGPRIGSDGRVLEWHAPLAEEEPDHRHVSHLAFAYPGAEVLDDELEHAVARSLEARGDEASGWSLAWKACLWARLRRPERVRRLLEMFLRDAETAEGQRAGLYPNLFSAHPPFQMDANFGIVAAVAECLVQSHRHEIELLPAAPEMLATGEVTGQRARH